MSVVTKGTTGRDAGGDSLFQPGLVNRECFAIAKDHGSLDNVLKLADVPWPVVSLKKFKGLARYIPEPLPRFPGITIAQVFDQQRNVVYSFAE